MKVVVVSDLHAHNFSQFSTTLPGGRNSRFQNILNVLRHVRDFCKENMIDVVFFCGDMFHSRTKVDVDVFSATWTAWREIAAVVREVVILVGNHDQYNKVGDIHSLEPFREFATVVDSPVISSVSTKRGVLRYAAHPFTTDIEAWKSFASMIPSGLDYFFFHQGVTEALTGAFDITIKAEVDIDDLPLEKARWCLGGHYHKHQIMERVDTDKKRYAIYVGSPLQHNQGERTEKKGFLHFPDQEQFFQVPTKAPEFRLFNSWDEYQEAPADQDDFVKIRCAPADVALIKDQLPSAQVEVLREEQEQTERVDQSVVSNDRSLLEAYVKQTSRTDLNQSRLVSLGYELLKGIDE